MELFIHHEASPYVRKVLLVCEELDLHPEEHKVDITSSEAMDEYRKINPNAKFPSFRDGELVLWESNAILIYLAQHSAGKELAISDSRLPVLICQWLLWELAHFGATVLPLASMRLGYVSQSSRGSQDVLLKEFHRVCSVLDSQLDGRSYVLGEQPSLPDFAIASDLTYSREATLPLAQYSHLSRWFANVQNRSSWRVTEDRKDRALASGN